MRKKHDRPECERAEQIFRAECRDVLKVDDAAVVKVQNGEVYIIYGRNAAGEYRGCYYLPRVPGQILDKGISQSIHFNSKATKKSVVYMLTEQGKYIIALFAAVSDPKNEIPDLPDGRTSFG